MLNLRVILQRYTKGRSGVLLGLVLLMVFWGQLRSSWAEECCAPGLFAQPWPAAALEEVAGFVQGVLQGTVVADLSLAFLAQEGPVYVGLRYQSRRRAQAWSAEGLWREGLNRALKEASSQATGPADAVEIVLHFNPRSYDLREAQSKRALEANIHRGMRSLVLRWGGVVERYPSTYALASNRSNKRLIQRFGERYGLSREQVEEEVDCLTYDGLQLLVALGDRPQAKWVERGNNFVPLDEITAAKVDTFVELAALWLKHNLHQDGRMTYKYWPSRGQESEANNTIRQWMATVALAKVAKNSSDGALWSRIGQNIDYNLGLFYRQAGELGLIQWNNKVKLGAVALAALSIAEHPQRQRWGREEAALRRTVESLSNEDGSFDSFYLPKGRNDNQNFYPGEALLLWATLYQQDRDEGLLQRFMQSFHYYRQWHRSRRNPAFVPWHTQAYYAVWQETQNSELAEFVLEMNDWLLGMQQGEDDVYYRDTRGRFYDPDRPFGPPHASATGVYLEGLADAFALARHIGDTQRAARYRRAILRGLRSAVQLQFADEIDMFYVSPPKRGYVLGGLRTTVYDNQIRCDNVQHNLMAGLKILQVFKKGDYSEGH